MKNLKIAITLLFAFLFFTAQAQTDKATTEKILAAKTYTFVATQAMPLNAMDISKVFNSIPGNIQNAGNINLNDSYYEVKITPDSLISYLPYFGRSFTAPINRDDNGYRFTSTKFDYKMEKGRKRGWRVNVNAKDVRDNPRMTLNITDSGYATLSVVSTNKQVINYNGYLKENKKD